MTAPGHDLTGDTWATEDVDVDRYVELLGIVTDGDRGLDLLERIHAAHVRTFPFSNIDVLLDQHPGVSPADVSDRMLVQRRGGMCFEHTQLMAAALEREGYAVERRLGRVHSPANTRTHAVLVVTLEQRRYLLDPGFGLSITGPLELTDGAQREEALGTYRVSAQPLGGAVAWVLERNGEVSHLSDELPVVPRDVRSGHLVIAEDPTAGPFHRSVVVSRYLDDSHITVTSTHRTVRRPGRPTEKTPIDADELITAVRELGIPLAAQDEAGLRRHRAQLDADAD